VNCMFCGSALGEMAMQVRTLPKEKDDFIPAVELTVHIPPYDEGESFLCMPRTSGEPGTSCVVQYFAPKEETP
jgi:hypothetical protein